MAEVTVLAVKLSALGGIVCVDGRAGEIIITAKSEGISTPGFAVCVISTIGATEGEIVGCDDSAVETFMGFLLPKYNTDCDTFVTDHELVEIVVPTSGHKYNVAIENPSAALAAGTDLVFGDTIGNMEKKTPDALTWCPARTWKGVTDTSRFCTILWI
jgi:hypothetical protein